MKNYLVEIWDYIHIKMFTLSWNPILSVYMNTTIFCHWGSYGHLYKGIRLFCKIQVISSQGMGN